MEEASDEDDHMWQIGVFDAHCHPTDIMASVESIANMRARVLTVMATRAQDQDLVAEAASRYPVTSRRDLCKSDPRHVIPAFGWHPWFSYQIHDDRESIKHTSSVEHYRSVLTPTPEDDGFLESLPTPKSLKQLLEETEERLRSWPFALVGEVGLDRSFRLPHGPYAFPGDTETKIYRSLEGTHTPGSREGRSLTPYHVDMEHQKIILRAQLELAAKLGRAVSLHSVQAHGVVFDTLQSMWKGHERPSRRQQKRRQSASNTHIQNESSEAPGQIHEQSLPYPPRICMHSYSGPREALRQFLAPSVPCDIYFSFSDLINFSTSSNKAVEVIKAVPDDRILIESDLHCAGDRMDGLLKNIIIKVCEIKGWQVADGAKQLKKNWETFIFGP